jgi:hypothetical protein
MRKSNSKTQKEAEKEVIEILKSQHGWNLEPEGYEFGDKRRCEVDGIDKNKKIMCEIYCRIGKTSSSRDKKMVSDAAKMLAVQANLNKGDFTKYLVLVDNKFASYFDPLKSKKWQAHAIKEMGVRIKVVNLSNYWKRKIKVAQENQK